MISIDELIQHLNIKTIIRYYLRLTKGKRYKTNKKWKKVSKNFKYTSDLNLEWMSGSFLHKWILANKNHIGKI